MLDYNKLDKLVKKANKVDKHKSFREDFILRIAHSTTEIEGNTLTLLEKKVIIEDMYSPNGNIIEALEVINAYRANEYIYEPNIINEEYIKDIHEMLMLSIIQGGIYRQMNVAVRGASWQPCDWSQVRDNMKFLIEDYNSMKGMHVIDKAAFLHAEFIRIHPFQDGNGRTARALLNHILIQENYLPINIEASMRLEYFKTLDTYCSEGNLEPFKEFIYKLEMERCYES